MRQKCFVPPPIVTYDFARKGSRMPGVTNQQMGDAKKPCTARGALFQVVDKSAWHDLCVFLALPFRLSLQNGT